MSQTIDHRYLRPGDLAALRHLSFSPRRATEGRYAGRHASIQRGHSVEFSDYRQYLPGDSPADIDWKVFGRSDRLYIKMFEHVSDMGVALLVDASASMAYNGMTERPRKLPASKYDHAARLAAAIAFLVARQQDRVAFAVARHGLRHYLPPAAGTQQTVQICRTLERVKLGERADLALAVERLAQRTPRRTLLVVLSDLLDEPGPVLEAMQRLLSRGGEVIVFHVMHADELRLPDDVDAATLTDAETGDRLSLSFADVRRGYESRLRRFLDTWSDALTARGIDYNLAPTDRPFTEPLESYLVKRGAKA